MSTMMANFLTSPTCKQVAREFAELALNAVHKGDADRARVLARVCFHYCRLAHVDYDINFCAAKDGLLL